jgi:hypothetical protein
LKEPAAIVVAGVCAAAAVVGVVGFPKQLLLQAAGAAKHREKLPRRPGSERAAAV